MDKKGLRKSIKNLLKIEKANNAIIKKQIKSILSKPKTSLSKVASENIEYFELLLNQDTRGHTSAEKRVLRKFAEIHEQNECIQLYFDPLQFIQPGQPQLVHYDTLGKVTIDSPTTTTKSQSQAAEASNTTNNSDNNNNNNNNVASIAKSVRIARQKTSTNGNRVIVRVDWNVHAQKAWHELQRRGQFLERDDDDGDEQIDGQASALLDLGSAANFEATKRRNAEILQCELKKILATARLHTIDKTSEHLIALVPNTMSQKITRDHIVRLCRETVRLHRGLFEIYPANGNMLGVCVHWHIHFANVERRMLQNDEPPVQLLSLPMPQYSDYAHGDGSVTSEKNALEKQTTTGSHRTKSRIKRRKAGTKSEPQTDEMEDASSSSNNESSVKENDVAQLLANAPAPGSTALPPPPYYHPPLSVPAAYVASLYPVGQTI